MKAKDIIWPMIGVGAALFAGWLLYREIRYLSLQDVLGSIARISLESWVLSALSALAAYAALAAYDQVALLHLQRRISHFFVAVTSFTTYALSHNIGASVFSGAVVRYRAYTSKGLSGTEVGILVAFCSVTFFFGALMLGAVLLVFEPEVLQRFAPGFSTSLARGLGIAALLGLALYVVGSIAGLRPIKIGHFLLEYPRPAVVIRQLMVAPLEIIAAAAIIYFALPEAGNPGFAIVLGIFVASFGIALLSHAPGGLGVLEFLFITALPELAEADVLAALLIFRLLYLLIPLAISIIIILIFEKTQLSGKQER